MSQETWDSSLNSFPLPQTPQIAFNRLMPLQIVIPLPSLLFEIPRHDSEPGTLDTSHKPLFRPILKTEFQPYYYKIINTSLVNYISKLIIAYK